MFRVRVSAGEELEKSGGRGLGLNRTAAERLALRVSVGEELEVLGGGDWG